MGVPLLQQARVGAYIVGKRLKGVARYPLVLMLEPLFRCNLACAGCGKIQFPRHILDMRLGVDECLAAAEECGAPIVSIPGGEPLIHPEIAAIVDGLVAQKRFVYLCTNALLLEKKLQRFTPSPYLTFSIHLDGLREVHDAAVCRNGVFKRAVRAIKAARDKGFRINVNCTLFTDARAPAVIDFFEFVSKLGIEGITVSPGFEYEKAPDHESFLRRDRTKELFRAIFRAGRGRRWPINHSVLYLDFLAGNRQYRCTPWGNPTRNVFGWQRPCYLLGEGYAKTFRELMEETGETANLAISSDGHVVFVSQVETHNPIRAFFRPGTRGHMHASGIGKALLLTTLHDMRAYGYGYGIIGGAGPVAFYQKLCDAVAIAGSEPGIYRGVLREPTACTKPEDVA